MDNVENPDLVVEMCRQTITDIIQSVGGVGNLLADEGRMQLVQMIVARLEQLGADVKSVLGAQLAQAYFQGITDGDAFLSTDGVDGGEVNKQMHLAGVEAIVADTMEDMDAAFRTAAIFAVAGVDQILQAVNDEISKGMILGDPSRVVSQRVQQVFAQNGMTSFVTKDGKRLPLDFYAQTVTRTKMRVAHTTGATNRYTEAGVMFVKINEHHPTCGKCAAYQGKVVALDPENTMGFPSVDDVPLPPYHPNCQHVVRPFVMEGHSDTDVKNEKKKWNNFDPENDPRTAAQKDLYSSEQQIRRKARQEMKEYALMQAHLGDEAPKTLAAYRRMKRKGDDKWKALQDKYKTSLGVVDGDGPGPGTPRRRSTPKNNPPTGGAPVAKTSNRSARQTKSEKPQAPAEESRVETPQNPPERAQAPAGTNTRPNIGEREQKALDRFDEVIDGIEFSDRRQTSRFLASKIGRGSDLKISVKKTDVGNGYCQFFESPDGRLGVSEYVLLKNDTRPDPYKHKTMFHEFYHLNAHGLDRPSGGLGAEWTKWEETATETAAFYMAKRAGVATDRIVPSYQQYLSTNLPRLKQLDEFKDCERLEDFGAVFMKYRFNPDTATAKWANLSRRVSSTKEVDMLSYYRQNYKDHAKQNIDRYEDMLFEALSQENKFELEPYIRPQIRKGLEDGILRDKPTREFVNILPVLYNEVGVK